MKRKQKGKKPCGSTSPTGRGRFFAQIETLRVLNQRRSAARPRSVCAKCGNKFPVSPSEKGRKKYCSWACRKAHMRGRFGPNFGNGAAFMGSKNPNWKNGSTEVREANERFRWRRRVCRRDKYVCQRCGSRWEVCAHHIRPWKTFPKLRYDVDNGICLCRKCHVWVHSPHNKRGEHVIKVDVAASLVSMVMA